MLLHFQNLHMSFMRVVPPYKDQAKVWVELLKYFQFKKVVLLGSSDQEGRAILGRFRNFAEDADIEVRYWSCHFNIAAKFVPSFLFPSVLCVCLYAFICLCTLLHTCLSLYMSVCVHACVHVCVHAFMLACMHYSVHNYC